MDDLTRCAGLRDEMQRRKDTHGLHNQGLDLRRPLHCRSDDKDGDGCRCHRMPCCHGLRVIYDRGVVNQFLANLVELASLWGGMVSKSQKVFKR